MRTKRDILTDYLVMDARAGNRQAFDRLVRLWMPPLQSFVYHQTGTRVDLADIMQDVWVAISRSLGKLEDPARFKHWAYRIARNKSVDWIRRRQSDRAVFREDPDADATEDMVPMDGSDTRDILRRELAQMPHAARQVLVLHYMEDFNVRDMARLLGIPEGTVKSRLFHARQDLKRKLEQHT